VVSIFLLILLSSSSSFFFFSSPNLSGLKLVSTILPHICSLSANLECMSEMCCTRLAEIQDAKLTQQELSYRRESRPLRLSVTGRQTTSIHRHGPKKLGRAAVSLWVVELDRVLLLMFGEYLYHRHYGGDRHFLNVPSSLRRPVSSQVSSKYILNVTYLLSYF